VLAQADTDANAEAVGFVATVPDANTFTLKAFGLLTTGLAGLTPGEAYFLDPAVAGAIVTPSPTGISKPVLVAASATSGWVFNMRGIEGGSSGGLSWQDVAGGPGFEDSWVNFAGGYFDAAYAKDDRRQTVLLRGLVKDGTISGTIFTLPAGFRPPATAGPYTAWSQGGTPASMIEVTTAGEVNIFGGNNGGVSLWQIEFTL
jgi:hypothetical protein